MEQSWRSVESGLRTLAVAAGASVLLWMVERIFAPDWRSWPRDSVLIFMSSLFALRIAAQIMVAIAAVRLSRAPQLAMASWLAVVAAAQALAALGMLAAAIWPHRAEWIADAIAALSHAAIAASLVILARHFEDSNARIAAIGAVILSLAEIALIFLSPVWTHWILLGRDAALAFAALSLLSRTRQIAEDAERAWQISAQALGSYASLLSARIAIAIGAAALAAMTSAARAPKGQLFFMALGALIGDAVAIAMTAALVKLGRLPRETRAPLIAEICVLFTIAALCLDARILPPLLHVALTPNFRTLRAFRDVQDLAIPALLAAIAASGLLLIAFLRIARQLGKDALARRIPMQFALVGAILVAAMASGFAIRRILQARSIALLIAIAITFLALAIWTLIRYVGIVRDVQIAVEAKAYAPDPSWVVSANDP